MKNNYRVEGDTVIIEVVSKGVAHEVLVDVEDIERIGNRTIGMITKGYTGFRQNGKAVYLHRFLTNCPADKIVDHINGNRFDNRKENLRVCTHVENNRNINNKITQNKTSGVRNVGWDKTRECWVVKLTVNNKSVYYGSSKALEEAKRMAEEARKEYWSA
jgi:HNH endonuclease/AP2 domain